MKTKQNLNTIIQDLLSYPLTGQDLLIALGAFLLVSLIALLVLSRSRSNYRQKFFQADFDNQILSSKLELKSQEHSKDNEERDSEIKRYREIESALQEKIRESIGSIASLTSDIENEKRRSLEQEQLLLKAKENLLSAFGDLSGQALAKNTEEFLRVAEDKFNQLHKQSQSDLDSKKSEVGSLVDPIKLTLTKFEEMLSGLEVKRASAYSGIEQLVTHQAAQLRELQNQTQKLSTALRSGNSTRGNWGEQQLKRLVEMVGLTEYADFYTQKEFKSDGSQYRPDMIIMLPGDRVIAIDSKVPLSAYYDGINCQDPTEQRNFFVAHAKSLRDHVVDLSRKKYWEKIDAPCPDFVVLFLPIESLLSTALMIDPNIFELAAEQRVVIATPTTLLALLRVVEFGWRQETLALNAKEIQKTGSELFLRFGKFSEHLAKTGDSLKKSVENFNSAVSSYETRLIPGIRRFVEFGIGKEEEIKKPTAIDTTAVSVNKANETH